MSARRRRRGQIDHRSHYVWGVATLVLFTALVAYLFLTPEFFRGGYDIRAAFVTSNNLMADSVVRVAGVNVGKVDSIEAGPDGRGAVVQMHIDDESVRLHRDMRMKIRPRLLLEGNYYVDISPGSPSAPVVDSTDAVVPVQQTASPVQINQVVTVLQDDTRRDLQRVLDEYGRGLSGGGARAINRSIPYWTPAYRDTAIANDAMLGEADDDVERFIDTAGAVAAALDRQPAALQGLVRHFATTADAMAREDDNLAAAIGELPRTFDEGTRAMEALDVALPPLRRLIADLRPTVRAAGPSVEQGARLARQAAALSSRRELGRAVPRLRAAVPPLARLSVSARPVNSELRAFSSCQTETVGPWSEDKVPDAQFPPTAKIYQEAAMGLVGVAGESRNFDANGQYVRVSLNGGNYAYALQPGRYFITGLPLQGVNPARAEPPALRPEEPCEDQQPPDLRSKPQPPPEAIQLRLSTPTARARWNRARARAIRWLRSDLMRLGLSEQLKVSTEDLRVDELPALREFSAAARRGGG